MINKYFKAFTVLETLISLMLIGIIITITYSLFNLIGKQLSMFQEENLQILEYNLFNSTIVRDVEKSNSFDYAEGNINFKFYDETEVNYTFNLQYILRQNKIKIDTFNLKVINHQFLNIDENKLNNSLTLSIKVLNDTVNANYFLRKDLSEIINRAYF